MRKPWDKPSTKIPSLKQTGFFLPGYREREMPLIGIRGLLSQNARAQFIAGAARSRETYEANIKFIEETVRRLERNEVSIDELESLSKEFKAAQQFCNDRLTRIESVVKATLATDERQAGERA